MRNLLTILFLVLLALRSSADEVRTLTGKTHSGKVTKITATEIAVDGKDGAATVPMTQVLAVQFRAVKPIEAGSRYANVTLLDDTVLHCKEAQFRGKQADLTLTSGATISLPVSQVLSFVRGAEDGALMKKWAEIARQRPKKDRIIIERNGELNPLEGLLGEFDAKGQSIEYKRDGADPINVPLEKLHGFIFYRTEGIADTPICKVIDANGNTLLATKLEYADDKLAATLLLGGKIELPEAQLSSLDFNMGKLTYLSDLEPSKVQEKSGIGLIVRYRKDANLDGEPIILRGQSYNKGLSMHAYTEIEYRLDGKFKDLKGMLGVDERTGSDSKALVSIYCDGEKQFSEAITPRATRNIALSVKDVGTLRIVVSSRDFLDLHDHVTFADARVSQ